MKLYADYIILLLTWLFYGGPLYVRDIIYNTKDKSFKFTSLAHLLNEEFLPGSVRGIVYQSHQQTLVSRRDLGISTRQY